MSERRTRTVDVLDVPDSIDHCIRHLDRWIDAGPKMLKLIGDMSYRSVEHTAQLQACRALLTPADGAHSIDLPRGVHDEAAALLSMSLITRTNYASEDVARTGIPRSDWPGVSIANGVDWMAPSGVKRNNVSLVAWQHVLYSDGPSGRRMQTCYLCIHSDLAVYATSVAIALRTLLLKYSARNERMRDERADYTPCNGTT